MGKNKKIKIENKKKFEKNKKRGLTQLGSIRLAGAPLPSTLFWVPVAYS